MHQPSDNGAHGNPASGRPGASRHETHDVLASIGPDAIIMRADNDLRIRVERRHADLRRLAVRWDLLSSTVGSPAAAPLLTLSRATG